MTTWIVGLALVTAVSDLDNAIQLRREGRVEEALAIFGNVLSSDPASLLARRELGHTLALAGRYPDALSAYQLLASSSEPRWQIESAKWRSLVHLYMAETEQALTLNQQEGQIARGSGDGRAELRAAWYRGHVLTELGRFAEANEAFLEALELDPDSLDTLHLAGVLTARQGDVGSLRYQIEDLQVAVSRSGDSSQWRRVYHLQAELALLQRQPEKALPKIEEANRLFPHPLYQDTMARCHQALGNSDAAEKAYNAIVTSTDERLDIPLYYLRALRALEEVRRAR